LQLLHCSLQLALHILRVPSDFCDLSLDGLSFLPETFPFRRSASVLAVRSSSFLCLALPVFREALLLFGLPKCAPLAGFRILCPGPRRQ